MRGKNYFYLFGLSAVFAILLFFGISAVTGVNFIATNNIVYDCGNITQPGNYIMNVSLDGASVTPAFASSCIHINSSNVVFDCNNSYIRNTTLSLVGILVLDDVALGPLSNVTIRNCNITMNDTGSTGIWLSNAPGAYINNTLVNNNKIGLQIDFSDNSTLEKISASGNTLRAILVNQSHNTTLKQIYSTSNLAADGLRILGSHNSTILDSIFNSNLNGLSFIENSSDNLLANLTLNSNTEAIGIRDGFRNSFFNFSIWNCSSATTGCINLRATNGSSYLRNSFYSGIVNLSSSNLIIIYGNSSNSTFKDITLLGGTLNDTSIGKNSLNNTFLNVTYNISKEYVITGSELIRFWYLGVNSSTYDNSPLSGANVSGYNSTMNYKFSLLSLTDGTILFQIVKQYINNGLARVYDSNYTINVTKTGFTRNMTSANITGNTILNFSLKDGLAPAVSLSSPSDDTDTRTTNRDFTFNVVDDSNVTNCSLYVRTGTQYTNTSYIISKSTSNIIRLESMDVTNYTWSINCTDSAGNTGNSTTWHYNVSATPPDTTDTSSPGSGGSLGGVWNSPYYPNEYQLGSGYTREYGQRDNSWFRINGESHIVGVYKIVSGNYVVINVSSTPQQATLYPGDIKKFEVNNDNKYDIQVKLNNIFNNKANLTIKTINESYTPTTGTGNQTTGTTTTGTPLTQTANEIKNAANSISSNTWLLIGGALIIILAIGLYFYRLNLLKKQGLK